VSDLRRWSEEGASAEEVSALDALRRERAPAKVVGLVLAGGTAAATTAAAATASAVTKSGLTGVVKVLAVLLLGGGTAGWVALHVMRPAEKVASQTTMQVERAAPAESSRSASPVPVGSDSTAMVPVAPPAPLVPVVQAPIHSGQRPRADSRLSREVAALESVQNALTERNPEVALRLLDRYAANFPAGALSSEATVFRVRALLLRGDRAGAQAIVNTYSVAHPESPYAKRLRGLLGEEPSGNARVEDMK
jgi:hypothetical protein